MTDNYVRKFLDRPGYLGKGAGYLSKQWHCSKTDVIDARREARRILAGTEKAETANYIAELEQRVSEDKGTLESTTESTFNPKTHEELAALHKINLKEFRISNYWSKLKSNGRFTSSVFCTRIDKSIPTGDGILDIIRSYKPEYWDPTDPTRNNDYDNPTALFIDITDFHLDKMDVYGTTIEDKKLQYQRTLFEIVTRAYHSNNIEEIIFIIGSDFLHTDTYFSTTTKGTPQSTNSTWNKSFEIAFQVYADSILFLKDYCERLKVVLVAGNHSYTKEYYLAFALKQAFINLDTVDFDISPDYRKCVTFGSNFIGLHHGNCKQDQLPLIFAKEFSQQWGIATHYIVITGDKHHTLEKDISGVLVKQLPALTNADEWHSKSNYHLAEKFAIGIIFDKEKGQTMNIIVK